MAEYQSTPEPTLNWIENSLRGVKVSDLSWTDSADPFASL